MVQFNPTATTFDATNHAIAFGTSISNLQIDCNSFGAGMGIQNWWAQEVSYVRDVGVDNCLGIALDVETTSAMNSGPYADIVSSPGSSAIASTQCVELLNTGDLRGVHGLTCTSTGTPKVGVDVSTQNVTLDDLHLEGFFTGIEVGVYTATNASYVANNVTIVNATGGTGSGGMTTLIDIAGSASSANQVNVFGLGAASSVNGSVTNLINDHITSNTVTTTNDPSLSFYILGLVSGSGRTLLTSSPNVNTNIGNSIQFVPLNGTIQSQSVGQPLTVQAAAGATSSTGGAVSILGGTYNGSTSGQNGGAVSLHGGDITGASASNTNIGGSATVSGGNGTAGNASGGNATLQAGVPASSMGSLGQTIVNQPFFAGASVTAGQVVKFVGNSSVGPTTSGTDTTRMVGFATQTVTSGHVVEVQVAGLVTNATTESNCTRGDWVVLAGTGSPSGTVQCQGNGALASGGTVIGIATQTVNSFPATLSLLIAPR
jgi:hypothetical protein